MSVGQRLSTGQGGLTKVQLQAADGASAEVYCHGAHVTSWRTADGEEQLFLSSKAQFKPGSAIRGGVPIIFPQFAEVGPLLKHGFARAVEWQYAPSEDAESATFTLASSAATRQHWPFEFRAEYRVRIGGNRLQLALHVTNTDIKPLSFTAALHTYLKVGEVNALAIHGLSGLRYCDTAAGGIEDVEMRDAVRIDGEVDRIYFSAGRPATKAVIVDEPVRRMQIDMQGFKDTVVWNPGAQTAAALSDLEVDGFRRMLCVEAAAIEHPVVLSPGATWQGQQVITRC